MKKDAAIKMEGASVRDESMAAKLVNIMGVDVVADEVVEEVDGSSETDTVVGAVAGVPEQVSGEIVNAPLSPVVTRGCSLAPRILRNGVVPAKKYRKQDVNYNILACTK